MVVSVLSIEESLSDIIYPLASNVLFYHHAAITLYYLDCWPITLHFVYYEVNIRYLYVMETYNKRLNSYRVNPNYSLVIEVRDSLKSLRQSKDILSKNLAYIRYFVLPRMILYNVTIILFIINSPYKLSIIFYLSLLSHTIVTHLITIVEYYHLWCKRKNEIEIENKLVIWNC